MSKADSFKNVKKRHQTADDVKDIPYAEKDPEFFQMMKEVDESSDNVAIEQANSTIVKIDDDTWQFRKFRLSSVGIKSHDNIDAGDIDDLGWILSSLGSATQFWIGDWANMYIKPSMNDLERGQRYDEIAKHFDIPNNTIRTYASVCRNMDVSMRMDTLNFTIHRLVVECHESLKGRELEMLDWANENHPTTRVFKTYINGLMTANKPSITENSFLFSKNRIPKVNTSLQEKWSKARGGNAKARTHVIGKITEFRQWLNDLEDSLEGDN